MALIRTDPSQTRTVVVLLVVLAAAVVFVFMRVSSRGQVRPADTTEPTANEPTSTASAGSTTYDASRNPFKRPAILKTAMERVTESLSRESASPSISRTGPGTGFWRDNSAGLDPMDFGSVFRTPARPSVVPAEMPTVEKPRPEFALLATVKSTEGWCAVIKSADSRPRVVEVGDIVEGGFKVRRVEIDRAVLTDGREIIIAKRPRT